jgi:hypothetical protein
MKATGQSKGYTLVYGEEVGANLFFVRTDLLACPGLVLEDAIIYKPAEKDFSRKYGIDPDPTKLPNDSYPPPPPVSLE